MAAFPPPPWVPQWWQYSCRSVGPRSQGPFPAPPIAREATHWALGPEPFGALQLPVSRVPSSTRPQKCPCPAQPEHLLPRKEFEMTEGHAGPLTGLAACRKGKIKSQRWDWCAHVARRKLRGPAWCQMFSQRQPPVQRVSRAFYLERESAPWLILGQACARPSASVLRGEAAAAPVN